MWQVTIRSQMVLLQLSREPWLGVLGYDNGGGDEVEDKDLESETSLDAEMDIAPLDCRGRMTSRKC